MTAGGLKASGKYRLLGINNKDYRTHRLIFLMHHGYLPKQVDHIDNNKLNNRIENLREATKSREQLQLHHSLSDNTSGYKGVSFHKRCGKWHVQVKRQHGKKYSGGFHDTAEEANEAATGAARETTWGVRET